MAKQKAKLTLNDLRGMLGKFNCSVSINPSRISCGVRTVAGLHHHHTAKEQALNILYAMHTGYQVLFSDTRQNRDAWKEAKAIAHKGPVTTNPNTGNRIQVFIVTKDQVLDIYNYKPKK